MSGEALSVEYTMQNEQGAVVSQGWFPVPGTREFTGLSPGRYTLTFANDANIQPNPVQRYIGENVNWIVTVHIQNESVATVGNGSVNRDRDRTRSQPVFQNILIGLGLGTGFALCLSLVILGFQLPRSLPDNSYKPDQPPNSSTPPSGRTIVPPYEETSVTSQNVTASRTESFQSGFCPARISTCHREVANANFRSTPTLAKWAILGSIRFGDQVYLTGDTYTAEGVIWYEAIAPSAVADVGQQIRPNQVGWVADCFLRSAR